MSEEEDPNVVGVPIGGLTDVASDVSSQFMALVRRKIHRRTAVSQFAGFSWTVPVSVLFEFLSLLVHMFSVIDGKRPKNR